VIVRFLSVAAFRPDADSGAAGSVLAIGAALQTLGHTVDFAWEPATRSRVPHATASRLLELPRRQLDQVSRRLQQSAYDVVIVSQPFAYLVYERLKPRYPRTLFLNRTHGWEARLDQAQRRLGFAEPRGPGPRLLSHVAAAFTARACGRTARASHGIIAPSSTCAHYIRTAYALPPERTRVIPYGLGEAARRTASHAAPRTPARRMISVGNYLRLKGSHILEALLPRVARDFPDATITFVADSAAVPALERYYRPAFGERLNVLPWMDREQLNRVYAAHDVLLFPSLFEGFGKVWMEAMAAGLCVVGFAEGGLPDIAVNGREAWYCPPGDAAALAALLRDALADPPRTSALGDRARQRIQEYSWERTAGETVEYCQALGAA
jgi:glycosyltransferase involved in cell wall biosynthesis